MIPTEGGDAIIDFLHTSREIRVVRFAISSAEVSDVDEELVVLRLKATALMLDETPPADALASVKTVYQNLP